jgi:hypothetical protein
VVLEAKFVGTFRVTDTVKFRPSDPEQKSFATSDMRLRATLIVDRSSSNPGPGVEIAGVSGGVFAGKLSVKGVTGPRWPLGRYMTHGVVYGDGVRHTLFESLYVEGALLWGVQKVGKGEDAVEEIGSNSRVHYTMVHCTDCGLSDKHDALGGWANRYIGHSDNDARHGDERSTVELAKGVPPHIEEQGRSALLINGNVYGIARVIDGRHLEVFPRIAEDVSKGDEVLFAIGGGIFQDSVDFSLWSYGVVDVSWSGIGWYDANMYGNSVQMMHVSKVVIAGIIGSFPDGPLYGGFLGHLYTEGNVKVRGFVSWGDSSYTIGDSRIAVAEDFYRLYANEGETYRREAFPGTLHGHDDD